MKQQTHQLGAGHRANSVIKNSHNGAMIPVGERFNLKNYPCMEE